MTIASLVVQVAANHAQLTTDVQKIHGSLDGIVGMAKKVGGALGIAFGVSELIQFGKQVFAAADTLQKLKDKTGVTVVGLQQLQAIGDASGNTIEEMTSAINQMQRRLSGGEQSAVGALGHLGLSLTRLRSLEPDEQFLEIAKAIAGVKDPADQVRLAIELFGKSGAQILPSLKADVDKLAKGTIAMSQETVDALDSAGDAWSRYWRNATALAGNVMGAFLTGKGGMQTGTGFEQPMPVMLEDLLANMKGPKNPFLVNAPLAVADALAVDAAYTKLNGTIEQQAKVLKQTSTESERLDAIRRQGINLVEEMRIAEIAANQGFERSGKHLDVRALMFAQNTGAMRGMANETLGLTHNGLIPMNHELQESIQKMSWLAHATNVTNQEISKSPGLFGSFFGGLKGGFTDLLHGMTGGKGVSGFLGNIGKGITEGLGNIISGGLSSMIGMATNLAMKGLAKLGGWIKGLFGGPSAQELGGREVAAAFRDNMESMLSDTQRLEAGNDQWKQSVIVVRDAYIAAGRTEQEALAIMDALWKAEKQGAGAVKGVIEQIEAVMRSGLKPAIESTMASTEDGVMHTMRAVEGLGVTFGTTYENMRRDTFALTAAQRELQAEFTKTFLANRTTAPNNNDLLSPAAFASFDAWRASWLERNQGEEHRVKSALGNEWQAHWGPRPPGFAFGTFGRFLDFGAGTPVMLHGRERVMTEAEGRSEAGLGEKLDAIRSELRHLPRIMSKAMRDATQLGWAS